MQGLSGQAEESEHSSGSASSHEAAGADVDGLHMPDRAAVDRGDEKASDGTAKEQRAEQKLSPGQKAGDAAAGRASPLHHSACHPGTPCVHGSPATLSSCMASTYHKYTLNVQVYSHPCISVIRLGLYNCIVSLRAWHRAQAVPIQPWAATQSQAVVSRR